MKTNTWIPKILIFGMLCIVIVFGVYIPRYLLKAKPAPVSEFLPQSKLLTEQRDRFPFHKVWRNPDVDRNRYTEVLIRPVNTKLVAEMDWMQQASDIGIHFTKDIPKLSVILTGKIKEIINHDPNQRLKIVSNASPKTLILEMAIIEVLPTKAIYEKLGLSSLGTGTVGQGSVAMEARIRDGKTNEIIAMFADRELGKFTGGPNQEETWYSHVEPVIEEWALQFVELINTPPDHQVKDSVPFQLSIW